MSHPEEVTMDVAPDDAGGPKRRMFLAVPVTVEAAMALVATLPRLPGRPVTPANLHLTIRFLGDVDLVTSERLAAALDQTDLGGSFRIELGEMGAFPRSAKAAVLWVGLTKGMAELTRLNGVVEEACEEAGLEPEDRPFAPHLTISRIRPEVDVRPLLLSYRSESISWQAAELVLFESHLGRGGAIHQPREKFPL